MDCAAPPAQPERSGRQCRVRSYEKGKFIDAMVSLHGHSVCLSDGKLPCHSVCLSDGKLP